MVFYIQSSSIAFDETSSYWLAPKKPLMYRLSLVTTRKSGFHWSAFRNHKVVLTEKDRNKLITESDRSGPNHRTGPVCAGRA